MNSACHRYSAFFDSELEAAETAEIKRDEGGVVHIIFAALVLIGIILAVVISVVVGLDKAYQQEFDQSVFDKDSKVLKIREQVREKAGELDKKISANSGKISDLRKQIREKLSPQQSKDNSEAAAISSSATSSSTSSSGREANYPLRR